MGGKSSQTGLHICQSTTGETGKLLCAAHRPRVDLCSRLCPSDTCASAHIPLVGVRDRWEAQPSIATQVPTSHPASEVLREGSAACSLALLSGQRCPGRGSLAALHCVCWPGGEGIRCWQFSQQSPVLPVSFPISARSALPLCCS